VARELASHLRLKPQLAIRCACNLVVARELASHLRLKHEHRVSDCYFEASGEGTGFSSEIETETNAANSIQAHQVARELASHLRLKLSTICP